MVPLRRTAHRSKGAAALCLCGALAAGCGSPRASVRTVTVHVPRACAADATAYATFRPLGDFDGPAPETGYLLNEAGQTIAGLDDRAMALEVDVTEGARAWSGTADLASGGDVDVLVLPGLASCALSTSVDQRTGATIAPIAGQKVLVVGGSGDPTPRTYVADLTTGAIAAVGTGLLRQRSGASVTAFGEGALVAGGVSDDGTVLPTAEVYLPSLGGFDQQRPIQLGDARADQAAVVLGDGETLLVGGVGSDGATPLASMELVDPATGNVRTEGVARLSVARRGATALRLASGEVLVAGGFDGAGAPVAALEWVAGDAGSLSKRPRDLVVGAARAFAALDGGGALAVVAPGPSSPADFEDVWVIDADGALEPATPIGGALTAPVLFGGAGGAPVLWTGDRWLRWQPWEGAFGALPALDDTPARIGTATTSPDPGLALWIAEDTPALTGLRFDERDAYAPVPAALLVGDTSELAPDRLPATGVLEFDPDVGLVLSPGASAFVSDRSYADVTVDVDAPTGEPPLVVLRDETGAELEVGGPSCPGAAAAGVASIHVTRKGASVAWTTPDGGKGACAVSGAARVAIGVRGAATGARSVARNLRVTRPGMP